MESLQPTPHQRTSSIGASSNRGAASSDANRSAYLYGSTHRTVMIADVVLLSPGPCRNDKPYLGIEELEAVRYDFDLVPR
jgi:hypothetical protein